MIIGAATEVQRNSGHPQRTVAYDSRVASAIRRFDQPMASNPRNSRSRAVRVRTRSSTLGSRPGGASAAATGACRPATRWRMAAATWRLDRSLARHPSAPAASTAAVVSRWASPERTSSLPARPPSRRPASRSGRRWAARRRAALRSAGAWRPTRSPGRCGGPNPARPGRPRRQAASQAPRRPAHGDRRAGASRHWSLVVSKRSARWPAAWPAARAGALLEPALSGSLLPLSGDGRPCESDPGRFLDRSGLAVYTKPLLGLDRQVFGRPWSSSAVCGERRFWVMDPALSKTIESLGDPA